MHHTFSADRELVLIQRVAAVLHAHQLKVILVWSHRYVPLVAHKIVNGARVWHVWSGPVAMVQKWR